MNLCKKCGVALEEEIKQCPLCSSIVNDTLKESNLAKKPALQNTRPATKDRYILQRILWQVTSVVLFSCILSTLIIDLVVHKEITWSVYPVTVCTIIFSYASLFAFWHAKTIFKITVGLIISSLLFIVLDLLLQNVPWPLQLGLPLLIAINLVAVLLMGVIKKTRHRDLNIVAYTGVAIMVLCICIEGIISLYEGRIIIRWSVIVAACLLPVTAVLLFMHYRIKKDPDLKRIFHT
jgi:hypothetical protein